VDPEKLVEALKVQFAERLEARVANGAITADRATELRSQLEVQARNMVYKTTIGGMQGAAVGAGPAAGSMHGAGTGVAGGRMGAGPGAGGAGTGICDGTGHRRSSLNPRERADRFTGHSPPPRRSRTSSRSFAHTSFGRDTRSRPHPTVMPRSSAPAQTPPISSSSMS